MWSKSSPSPIKPEAVNVIFNEGQKFSIKYDPFHYRLQFVKEMTKSSRSITLKHNAEPVKTIDRTKEILTALRNSEDLPSFKEFQTARGNFKAQLDPFVPELKDVTAKGEHDWKI